jgi:hypothetical protein
MQGYRQLKIICAIVTAGVVSFTVSGWATADVQPGDLITKENMDKAGDLLIPTMQWFVQQGMQIKVIPYRKVELPKLYKEATEKYAAQVQLSPDGREIFNYVAGLPFPTIDPNDPLAGFKIIRTMPVPRSAARLMWRMTVSALSMTS